MCQISFYIPDEVLYDTKMNTSEANVFAREAVALSYYTKAGVSLGYCAEIAGMNKGEFIRLLGENNISIFQFESEDELKEDVLNA
ncbi:MAG TPA: antitoxin [Lachnospiraceae bacterium]|nr:antitoxin [Lachnospiraceae bacterium]